MGSSVLEDVGTYKLVRAVRRLLINQSLGMEIDYLKPGAVRPLFNSQLSARALSVFGCEFETYWLEEGLEPGRWPAPQSDADSDHMFALYRGRLDAPYG